MSELEQIVSLLDFEEPARAQLEPAAYDYYRSGAGEERTLRRNREAFAELTLLPAVLRDVGQRSLRRTVLGAEVSMPAIVAPTAFHRLAHPEGELATARAASAAGVAMALSTLSTTSLEQVAERGGGGPRFFQLYVFRDRGLTRELVERAAAAGYRAIVLTVDAPLLGRREADVRNRFELPAELRIASVPDGRLRAGEGESGLAAYFASLLDPTLGFDDLRWLCELSQLPVVVKGVHRADDARRAVQAGARGVVVSNHGGRQLDTVPAAIEMLPAIADAVGDELEVLVDGGVRRGTDIVKALALGARAVLVGRPVLWALAVAGEAGVRHCLELLRSELDEALALCGCDSCDGIDGELLGRRPA